MPGAMGSFPGCPRRADRTQPANLDSSGWPRASMGACRSRTNADDRLPLDPLGRVEGGGGIVEGRDVADVRLQSSVSRPLDDLTQLGTIGLDNEVDSPSRRRAAPRPTRPFRTAQEHPSNMNVSEA